MSGSYSRGTKSHRNPTLRNDRALAPIHGIYFAKIVDVQDINLTGRIKVFIPSLGYDETQTGGYRSVFWTSPFTGTTDPTQIGLDEDSQKDFRRVQKSYGIWMMTPDINNYVLVAFADGLGKHGYVLSTVYQPEMNYMIPGMSGGKSISDPDFWLPVSEKHKKYQVVNEENEYLRPLHVDFAETIVKQGLAKDILRGAGTSSARRESPSQVFGILTPGPRGQEPGDDMEKINFNHRTTGHQFVMDDNPNSRLVRIRTGGGHQLLMDDTSGVIYIINNTGTVWFEINNTGEVSLFSENSINIRTKSNFNLRADKDINIEAGNNINLKAAGEGSGTSNMVDIQSALSTTGVDLNNASSILGTSDNGGRIKFEAAGDIEGLAEKSFKMTAACGNMDIHAGRRITGTSKGADGIHFSAKGPFLVKSALTGISSKGVVALKAGASVIVEGTPILLNSGAAPEFPTLKAEKVSPIKTTAKKDAGSQPPTFDRNAGLTGNAAVTSNGERSGVENTIQTIIPVLLTAEPYKGHKTADPSLLKFVDVSYSLNVIKALPDFATKVNALPADAVVPEGYLKAVGSVDQFGSVVTATGASVPNTGQKLLNATEESLNVIKQVKGGINNNPVYEVIDQLGSTFQMPQNINFTSTKNVGGLLSCMMAATPVTQTPTSNPAGTAKVVGLFNKLTGASAQAEQIGVSSSNEIVDVGTQKFATMTKMISDAQLSGAGLDEIESVLGQQGIDILEDGAGIIFTDKSGNKLIDVSNGIGPVGTTLGAAAQMNTTFNQIKNTMTVPISENQALAMTSFAQNIGAEKFNNSNVLQALNQGAYGAVPHLMQGWSLASNLSGPASAVSELAGMRQFEASLFQCPDAIDLNAILPENFIPGEIPFSDLANSLDLARASLAGLAMGEIAGGLAPC
jgi:hypothetical protein